MTHMRVAFDVVKPRMESRGGSGVHGRRVRGGSDLGLDVSGRVFVFRRLFELRLRHARLRARHVAEALSSRHGANRTLGKLPVPAEQITSLLLLHEGEGDEPLLEELWLEHEEYRPAIRGENHIRPIPIVVDGDVPVVTLGHDHCPVLALLDVIDQERRRREDEPRWTKRIALAREPADLRLL